MLSSPQSSASLGGNRANAIYFSTTGKVAKSPPLFRQQWEEESTPLSSPPPPGWALDTGNPAYSLLGEWVGHINPHYPSTVRVPYPLSWVFPASPPSLEPWHLTLVAGIGERALFPEPRMQRALHLPP